MEMSEQESDSIADRSQQDLLSVPHSPPARSPRSGLSNPWRRPKADSGYVSNFSDGSSLRLKTADTFRSSINTQGTLTGVTLDPSRQSITEEDDFDVTERDRTSVIDSHVESVALCDLQPAVVDRGATSSVGSDQAAGRGSNIEASRSCQDQNLVHISQLKAQRPSLHKSRRPPGDHPLNKLKSRFWQVSRDPKPQHSARFSIPSVVDPPSAKQIEDIWIDSDAEIPGTESMKWDHYVRTRLATLVRDTRLSRSEEDDAVSIELLMARQQPHTRYAPMTVVFCETAEQTEAIRNRLGDKEPRRWLSNCGFPCHVVHDDAGAFLKGSCSDPNLLLDVFTRSSNEEDSSSLCGKNIVIGEVCNDPLTKLSNSATLGGTILIDNILYGLTVAHPCLSRVSGPKRHDDSTEITFKPDRPFARLGSIITYALNGSTTDESGLPPNSDWALIELDHQTYSQNTWANVEMKRPKPITRISPKATAPSKRVGYSANVLACPRNAISGRVSPARSTVFLGSMEFNVQRIVLDNGKPLAPGSSGAFVVDDDGGLCGMIIAGKGRLNWAYMLPILEVFESVSTFLGIGSASLITLPLDDFEVQNPVNDVKQSVSTDFDFPERRVPRDAEQVASVHGICGRCKQTLEVTSSPTKHQNPDSGFYEFSNLNRSLIGVIPDEVPPQRSNDNAALEYSSSIIDGLIHVEDSKNEDAVAIASGLRLDEIDDVNGLRTFFDSDDEGQRPLDIDDNSDDSDSTHENESSLHPGTLGHQGSVKVAKVIRSLPKLDRLIYRERVEADYEFLDKPFEANYKHNSSGSTQTNGSRTTASSRSYKHNSNSSYQTTYSRTTASSTATS